MKPPLLKAPSRKLLLPPTATLKVVVAYDSRTVQTTIEQLLGRLTAAFTGDPQFQTTWIRFDQLSDARFANEANEVTADADLIVIAVSQSNSLPLPVKRWTANWSVHGVHAGLALLVGVSVGQCVADTLVGRHFLEQAEEMKLTVFPGTFRLADEPFPNATVLEPKTTLAEKLRIPRDSWERWGINE